MTLVTELRTPNDDRLSVADWSSRKPSSSLMRASSLSAFFLIISKYLSIFPSGTMPFMNCSTGPRMSESGVLNSCEMLSKKRNFISAISLSFSLLRRSISSSCLCFDDITNITRSHVANASSRIARQILAAVLCHHTGLTMIFSEEILSIT